MEPIEGIKPSSPDYKTGIIVVIRNGLVGWQGIEPQTVVLQTSVLPLN